MSKEYNRLREYEEKKYNKLEQQFLEDKFKILEQETYDKNLFYSILDRANTNYWIIELINYIFNPSETSENKKLYINQLKKGGIKVIKYDNLSLLIKYRNKSILIQDLCSIFDQFTKEDYYSSIAIYKRENYIPVLLQKITKLGNKSKIMIGYISEDTLDVKKLYSWLEIKINNKIFVIDFINNIVINKEAFYMFYKPEILNEIKKENILNPELITILTKDFTVNYDEYLIFSKEFENEIQKKKELFRK